MNCCFCGGQLSEGEACFLDDDVIFDTNFTATQLRELRCQDCDRVQYIREMDARANRELPVAAAEDAQRLAREL